MKLVGPHSASAVELKERLEVERRGVPFLVMRDAGGEQRLIVLDRDRTPVTIGRNPECDLRLDGDEQVSRVHAELHFVAGGWALSDGGLSRNGTFVNGARIQDRRRLQDGDTMRFGQTAMVFRQPTASRGGQTTVLAYDLPGPAQLSAAQRAVLRALCRPFAGGSSYAKPATNAEIADELVLSLDAVKGHMRNLFDKFQLGDLPQNEKRLRLAERALTSGAVNLMDLRHDQEADTSG